MSERIDIANIALTLLGEEPITSVDDDSKTALAIKNNYDVARDAALEAYEWSFAITQFKPALNEAPPLWMYDYAFDIPSNILRVLAVESQPSFRGSDVLDNVSGLRHRHQVDHEVQGRQILTSCNPIYCTGIKRIDQEGLFSGLFIHAFAAKLAMLICYAVTESNSKFDRMAALFGGFIQEARSRDGQQSSTRRVRHNRALRVR